MKAFLVTTFVLGLWAAPSMSATDAADRLLAAPKSVEQAWADWEAVRENPAPDGFVSWTFRQQREWVEKTALVRRDRGLAFIEAAPRDPRRWSVAWRLIQGPPTFIASYGPDADKNYSDVVIDRAAATAWKTKLGELETALRAAPDLPPDVVEAIDLQATQKQLREVYQAGKAGSMNWPGIAEVVLAFAKKHPESGTPLDLMKGIAYDFQARHSLAETAEFWQRFAGSENARLASTAAANAHSLGAISGEIDLRFTAVDGREVDLKQLRGKVVLIDFWATWCGPCMAEMPNVRKAYETFREQGFEIIGVSCDFAPTPGQTGANARMAKTAEQVLEFKKKNGMSWPDYYDGRKHGAGGNAIAARFAVTGIPASFLLDRNGRVVAQNLRGEKLEAEIRRVLQP